ncbi:S-adenosylmethionine decarboxylase [Leptospira langatensis]|uniref:S-adenosylmethionine decarboxylase n=1 Tax=Leptospira langatensis TaxID=2484983 RepID=A0A5F1ZRL4_9LEPT|nr:S-adenosylmethionine decarboxylase [Leptospira langatensis]TGK01772.1 S-adenosylmethionine decarboxylase [Leptospira langatensis]TGL39378.1 S-adenosylmethionine decarboxylase [Leptospira langatensis]
MSLRTQDKLKIVNRFSYLRNSIDINTTDKGEPFVYTKERIPAGEVVAVWGGKAVHKDELTGLSGLSTPHRVHRDFYLVSPLHDDGVDTVHYIRQSSDANCGFQGDITLVALKDIEAGQEVTFHPAMKNPELAWARNEESEIVRKRFQGNFPTYIQSKIDSDPELKVYEPFKDGAWGLLTSIDLEECDAALIRDADAIKQYVIELCELIEMKRFGETQVVYFGEDDRVAGYSMVQLIETSCISAHFANDTNTSYIDIFSCKGYDPKVAAEFTRKFFKGAAMRLTVTNRF